MESSVEHSIQNPSAAVYQVSSKPFKVVHVPVSEAQYIGGRILVRLVTLLRFRRGIPRMYVPVCDYS